MISGQPSCPASGRGPFPRLGSGSSASARLGSGLAKQEGDRRFPGQLRRLLPVFFDPSHVSGSALLNTSTWKAVLKTPGTASSAALAILEQVDDAVAGDSKVGWGADTDDERAHRAQGRAVRFAEIAAPPMNPPGPNWSSDLVSLIQRRTTRPVVGLGPHLLDRSGAIRAHHRLVQ